MDAILTDLLPRMEARAAEIRCALHCAAYREGLFGFVPTEAERRAEREAAKARVRDAMTKAGM